MNEHIADQRHLALVEQIQRVNANLGHLAETCRLMHDLSKLHADQVAALTRRIERLEARHGIV